MSDAIVLRVFRYATDDRNRERPRIRQSLIKCRVCGHSRPNFRHGRRPKGVSMKGFPSFDLNGRVALVTGAARGLGNAIAQALAHAGADVALGLRDVRTGGEVAGAIQKMGKRVLPLQMDTAHIGQINAAIKETVARFGRLDILVNNAGVGPENPAELVREEDFDFTVNVNLKGTFFACQAAAKQMIAQKYGRIINMGSQAG